MKLYTGGKYEFRRTGTDWAVVKVYNVLHEYYRAEILDTGIDWKGGKIGETGVIGKNSALIRDYSIKRLDDEPEPRGKTDSQIADALIIYLEIKGNIDRALVSGDKDLFMNLSSSLKELEDMGVFA